MLINNIFKKRMPDILECIANLSSDEVFTLPQTANSILNLLPQEVWKNPELKFLDPACKTGIFLRECAKRLMGGLEKAIPDENKRREHIFKNMLYGVAITDMGMVVQEQQRNSELKKELGMLKYRKAVIESQFSDNELNH